MAPFTGMWVHINAILNHCSFFPCLFVFWQWGLWDLSSPTRDWTQAILVKAPSLNHWTTRKLPRTTDGGWRTCRLPLGWVSQCDTDMQFLGVNGKSFKVIMCRHACYFIKLDYGMNCRCFVTKKAQKGRGLIQKVTDQDTSEAKPGFWARTGFKASSITYWICNLGRLNGKGT